MLDFAQIAPAVRLLGERERDRRERVAEETALAAAIAEMDQPLWDDQVDRIRSATTSWLVAHSAESPATAFPAPEIPFPHAVVATDGSQIAPDRHSEMASCYLLNVGRVVIPYGDGSRPRLDSRSEVVFIDDVDEEAERRAVAELAVRRLRAEMAALGDLAEETSAAGLAAVAFTDGSLVAWTLEDDRGDDPAKQEALLALLDALDRARSLQVPLVGYVSQPGSREVVNALRVTICPEQPVSCGGCPHPKEGLPCAPIRRATDAGLFAKLLQPGERSPVFSSRGQARGFSHILQRYGEHWIAFFYLHVGAEIARVEVPQWVAEDPALLERVHAVSLDQARKGRGYPVCLAEAHERAVVRGADRQEFLSLLTRSLVHGGTPAQTTRKAFAKRTRAI